MFIVCYRPGKRHGFIIAVALFLAVFICPIGVQAEKNFPVNETENGSNHILFSGKIIAQEISKITGVAISPILGISVLGAYSYYTTPVEERDSVPWHARPAFWMPLLLVLFAILLKDSSKIILPKIILIPLDAIETLLEKNLSAALAILVLLSSITGRGLEHFQLTSGGPVFSILASAHAAGSVVGTASYGVVELWFLSMLVTVVFALVWVVSQSFNFLILLCPSSWIDLGLTISKNFLISLLLGSYLIHPYLGFAVSSVVILISVFLFARSYRFVIFGTVVSFDIVFRKTLQQEKANDHIKAFAGSGLSGVPALSYGKLAEQDNMLVFRYRPWLIRPSRIVRTAFACDQCEVGKALLAPVIITSGKNEKRYTNLFRLRPLYKSHESSVAKILQLKGVRDISFGKSLKEGFAWVGEQLVVLFRGKDTSHR